MASCVSTGAVNVRNAFVAALSAASRGAPPLRLVARPFCTSDVVVEEERLHQLIMAEITDFARNKRINPFTINQMMQFASSTSNKDNEKNLIASAQVRERFSGP